MDYSRWWCALVLLTLLPLIPAASAADPDSWIPARWPGGPLEVHRRAKQAGAPAAQETLEIIKNWYRPATLDLLNGTRINCLLVTWAAGTDATLETRQRELVADYAKEAGKRGIAVLGVVYPEADFAASLAAAGEAGLDGLVLDGKFSQGLHFSSAIPVIPLSRGAAPGVRALSDSDAATATPTSEPWIDSNTWFVRSIGTRTGLPIWLGFSLEQTSADDYARAIADAAAAGGKWAVALDDATIAGLERKEPKAHTVWRRISEYLTFCEKNKEWRRFAPTGPLGIVLDSGNRERDMYDEYFNLIARRRIPYRVIERRALNRAALQGLTAVLAAELNPPSAEERRLLSAFVEQGGLLVTETAWGASPPGQKDKPYIVRDSGKGRLVTYTESQPDPEMLARDMLSLIGRGNLGVRLFNAPSVLPYVSSDASGRRLLVQLINYASLPAEAITVRIAGDYRTARLYSPDAPAADLEVERSEGQVQVSIRSLPVYGALLLEKSQ